MEERVVNLTPHPITFADGEIPPSGKTVRLDEVRTATGQVVCPDGSIGPSRVGGFPINYDDEVVPWEAPPQKVKGIPIVTKQWGNSNLPPEQPGVRYIVSALVANAHPLRRDLLVPETKRDESGAITATALIENSPPTSAEEQTARIAADAYYQGVERAIGVLLRNPAFDPYAAPAGPERESRFILAKSIREEIRAGADTKCLGPSEAYQHSEPGMASRTGYIFNYEEGIVSSSVRAERERLQRYHE